VTGPAPVRPAASMTLLRQVMERLALEIPGGVLETLRQSEASGTVRRGTELTVPAVRQVARPRVAVPNSGT
jgi:hypothetical protein